MGGRPVTNRWHVRAASEFRVDDKAAQDFGVLEQIGIQLSLPATPPVRIAPKPRKPKSAAAASKSTKPKQKTKTAEKAQTNHKPKKRRAKAT